jgi:hypothetical protein
MLKKSEFSAVEVTDKRRGMNGLALQVQQALQRDPHVGDLYVFRGRRGELVKILWYDDLGMSLYAKRLGPVSLAVARRWMRGDFSVPDRPYVERDRLAKSTADLAPGSGQIRKTKLHFGTKPLHKTCRI